MTLAPPPPPQRIPADPAAARASTAAVTDLLESSIARAEAFTEEERNRRVNDEWTTVESVRHIVFVIDAWLSRGLKGEDDPFHPIGLPPHFMPRVLPGSSIDASAAPSFAEACEVLRGRLETLRAYTDAVTPEELARGVSNHAGNVAGALGVIFDELTFHCGFMNRDLDTIERDR